MGLFNYDQFSWVFKAGEAYGSTLPQKTPPTPKTPVGRPGWTNPKPIPPVASAAATVPESDV